MGKRGMDKSPLRKIGGGCQETDGEIILMLDFSQEGQRNCLRVETLCSLLVVVGMIISDLLLFVSSSSFLGEDIFQGDK
jgi:hypothetical protein